MPLPCAECAAFTPAASHARPSSSLTAEDAASYAECTAFIQAALAPARKRCRSCCPRYIFRTAVRCLLIILRHGKHSAFSPPPPLIAEDTASVRRMLCIHSGGFSRPQASDAAHAVCATYFRIAARCLSKYSASTANISLFAPAFAPAINRGRCRFRARNAPHSHQRLLSLVSDAAPVVRAAYFRTAAHCLLIILRHGNHSASHARPPSPLTAEDAASVCGKTLHSFRRLLTPARNRSRYCCPR